MTIRFLVTSLDKTILNQLLSLARRPALGRVLVVPNFFHIRMMEGHCAHWDLICCRNFSVPFPDLCLDTILSRRSTDNSLDFMAWFVL